MFKIGLERFSHTEGRVQSYDETSKPCKAYKNKLVQSGRSQAEFLPTLTVQAYLDGRRLAENACVIRRFSYSGWYSAEAIPSLQEISPLVQTDGGCEVPTTGIKSGYIQLDSVVSDGVLRALLEESKSLSHAIKLEKGWNPVLVSIGVGIAGDGASAYYLRFINNHSGMESIFDTQSDAEEVVFLDVLGDTKVVLK